MHKHRWGILENDFRAGNYLVTTDDGAHSNVKYYALDVSHNKKIYNPF